MKAIRNKTVILLLLFHAATASFAVDIYLAPAPTGSDENDGSTPESAVATLQTAYNLIPANNNGAHIIHVSGFINITAEVTMTNTNQTVPGANDGRKFLTIDGGDAATSGFDGGDATRLITLQGNSGAVTFKNLTFRNANATQGAIAYILNSGTHTFDRCKFHDNKNLGNNNSGNLHLYNANVTFIDCEFYNNQGARGGVMWMSLNAVISIKNCHFYENTATGQGGAIWQTSNAICSIESSIFENHDISENNTSGGAIAITNPNGFTIDKCIIRNNKSKNQGGAIYITGSTNSNKSVVIKNSLIADNVSTGSHGGGVYINNNVPTATLPEGTTLALDVSFINTTIFRNKTLATGYGGGLFVEGAQPDGSLKLINCTVVENETQGNGGHCGGINVRGTDQNISVYVYNSIFEDNFATNSGSMAYSDFFFSGGTAGIQQGELGTNAFISHSFFSRNLGGFTGSLTASNKVNYGATHLSGLALPYADYVTSQNSIPLRLKVEALKYGNAQYLRELDINTDQLGNIRLFEDGKCAAGAVEVPTTRISSTEISSYSTGSLNNIETVTLTDTYSLDNLTSLQNALGSNELITSLYFEEKLPDEITGDYFAAINPNALKHIVDEPAPENWTNVVSTTGFLTPLSLTDGFPYDYTGANLSTVPGFNYTRTVTPKQWYPMGFPFKLSNVIGRMSNNEIKNQLKVYDGSDDNNGNGDFWVKTYDGNASFAYSSSIEEDESYIIQFPNAFDGAKVSFVSGENPNITGTYTPPSDGYVLVSNPSIENLELSAEDRCYIYNPETNAFNLLENEETATIKPFGAFIVAGTNVESPLKSISVVNVTTGLNSIQTGDPVIETSYYTLQGVLVAQPVENGIYILKKVHDSKRVSASKIIYRKY
jgi:hypothetical protein